MPKQPPAECPKCQSQDGFTLLTSKIIYEKRASANSIEHIPRETILTWQCSACGKLIENRQAFET